MVLHETIGPWLGAGSRNGLLGVERKLFIQPCVMVIRDGISDSKVVSDSWLDVIWKPVVSHRFGLRDLLNVQSRSNEPLNNRNLSEGGGKRYCHTCITPPTTTIFFSRKGFTQYFVLFPSLASLHKPLRVTRLTANRVPWCQEPLL